MNTEHQKLITLLRQELHRNAERPGEEKHTVAILQRFLG